MGLGTKYKPAAPLGSGYKAKTNLPHLKLNIRHTLSLVAI